MREINLSADETISALLALAPERGLCLLDSGGVSNLGSHLLIAGIDPIEKLEITEQSPEQSFSILDEKLARAETAALLTVSYDFGLKLNNINVLREKLDSFAEPDIFLALFDVLIVHDYNLRKTFLTGNENNFDKIEKTLFTFAAASVNSVNSRNSAIHSNFARREYLKAIEKVQEFIRRGDTYQTNLTQQIRAELPAALAPEKIFLNLRKNHPAPFAAFFRRSHDAVISASPERFLKMENAKRKMENSIENNPPSAICNSHFRIISASPIKGTRRRGTTPDEDLRLREELLSSEKDRAENVMIVDLLRNDIGRICEYGSVAVEKLCAIEEHPTLYHLVSTVSGALRPEVKVSDILRATFPCGSITGAPKIRTMEIIETLETARRGLSMGAIGYALASSKFKIQNLKEIASDSAFRTSDFRLQTPDTMDLSVAIRTMTVRGRKAVFNVGGGITIDSDPSDEYEETLIKAQALLKSINADVESL